MTSRTDRVLSLGIRAGFFDYYAIGVGRFTITAAVASANAVVRTESEEATSGVPTVTEYSFASGSGIVYRVEVTAEDGGTVLTYLITAPWPPT